MFKVDKNEPEFFIDAKRRVNRPNESRAWSDENITNIRANLATEILTEQNSLCIYCEKSVEDYPKNCHIDHFKKRDLFPNETLNYNNLIISCNEERRCAKYKDKHISREDYNRFINPVIENPEDFLEYTFYGELEPKSNLSESDIVKAEFTIEILNLNDRSLVEERKNFISILCSFISQIETIEQLNVFKNFITLSKWILEHKTECNSD